MSFQRKLLVLLLVIALLPLLINGFLHRTSMQRIKGLLTTETEELLWENATAQLQELINTRALLQSREQAFLRQALASQAREVERQLAVSESAKAIDLNRTYQFVQQQRPDIFLWHATWLETGLQSIYPENVPDSSQARWYADAKASQKQTWQIDLVDSQLQMIAAQPVYDQAGTFAGVTAIALSYQQLFKDWQLPAPWNRQGRLFFASRVPSVTADAPELKVLFEINTDQDQQPWDQERQQLFNVAATQANFPALLEQIKPGQSGFAILDFARQESIWTYSVAPGATSFLLLIIPSEAVGFPARQAADFVEEQFISGLQWTALLTLGVVLAVIVTAIFRSRQVTKPVTALVQASEKLSQGDFSTRVKITSNDEFAGLGEAFNRIGPQLKERQEIKQSLAVAREIQQRLLPTEVPQLNNFELAGKLVYCDETGGDYYNFSETASGKLTICVGDVVGHGIGAALLMTSAAGILQAAIANGEEDLSRLLTSLNTFLEKDVGDTRFMTLFLALLDPAERSLQWLSAGHGPMFFYAAASGTIEEIPATTMPLGIMPGVDFSPAAQKHLAPGDILLIGTDGIWETSNPSGEQFGSTRLCEILQQQATAPAAELAAQILSAVESFRDTAAQDDDVTLVILKAT